MSKKNNKNGRPYNPQPKSPEDNENVTLEETMAEDSNNQEVGPIESITEEVLDENIETPEDHINDSDLNKATDVIEDSTPVEESSLEDYTKKQIENQKTVLEASLQKEKNNGVFTIVFVKNGSPLQISKILNRLKTLSIDYEYDRESATISGRSHTTLESAIREKKYLVGKGLKPSIYEGSVKKV